MNIEEFLSAYLAAALWSSYGDDGEPLDAEYGADDIAPETLAAMRADCADFMASNTADLAEYEGGFPPDKWTASERAGHDFWLTRNGHGAGFWNRDLGDLGCQLSDAATVYRGVHLYIGDDGKVHA